MHHFFTKKRLITLGISSCCLFIFSIILAFVIVPEVIDSQIDRNVRLQRGSDQWHRFVQPPFNISFNVTLFEVTNAEDVINSGAKPNLVEKGPYVFDEVMKKGNFSYNENNDTISYTRRLSFHFNSSRSGPNVSIKDTVTMINPAYVAVLQMVEEIEETWPKFLRPVITGLVKNCMGQMFPDGLLLKDFPIEKLLFDGVEVCDFNKCTDVVCKKFRGKSKTIEEVVEGDKHFLKFSFLNYKTRDVDGIYEVKTGMKDIQHVGSITNWNYSNYTKFWVQDRMNRSCDFIKGTDGTIFPPHITENTKITAYSTDICRYVDMQYDGAGTYRDIDGYVFKTPSTLFYSSLKDPHQDCFCKEGTLGIDGQKTCFMDGVMDFSPCIGAPVLLSYPHFLYADEKYREGLTGVISSNITPDPEKYKLYALLDKYTGIPLQAHKRVQMNIILRTVKNFEDRTKNLPRTILPVIWLDEGIDLPDSGIDLLNSLLYNTITIVAVLKWLFIGVTFGLTILSVILLCTHSFST